MKRTAFLGGVALLTIVGLSFGAWAEMTDGKITIDPEKILKPTDWFSWGGDLRVRQVYQENNIDLNTSTQDNAHFMRLRTRAWAKVGPFFGVDDLEAPSGVSGFIRMTHEARLWFQQPPRPTPEPHERVYEKGNFNEIAFDNLWAEWERIVGLPVSIRVGRQDLMYGHGWVILDGTPLDDSRTTYFDAVKTTLHFDEANATLDFVVYDNKGYPSRLTPINKQRDRLSDYDATGFWLYLQDRYMENHEAHAYYIYKDEDRTDMRNTPGRLNPVPNSGLRNGRVVSTLGALVQGSLPEISDAVVPDYYAESAFQWGREGSVRRRAYGFNSDLGCKFPGVVLEPRLHAGFEFLSGDDPSTTKYEGWDPVFSRWARNSELYAYRWAAEGCIAMDTNLQRYTAGVSCTPMERMTLAGDFSHLRIDQRTFTGGDYGGGNARGNLLAGKMTYDFNRWASGHLWLEYFHPESYYAKNMDDAIFARWELTFKLQ